MDHRAYFDIPIHNKKHFKGSSPLILNKLIIELRNATAIYISFFLFNNPALQKALENLSANGCKVKIYSIPLQGYDTKEHIVYENEYKKKFCSSKYKYASKIYNRIQVNQNMELKLFHHTYVWYTQKFSRGKEAYSLHNKSILAEFPDGSNKCMSSSCNFALGDPPHSENMLVVEDCPDTYNMFETYFGLLDKYSYTMGNYINVAKTYYDFQYVVKPVDLKEIYQKCYFSAPFIKYEGIGSNHYIQKRIIDLLKTAKRKIYICSQHFSNINSFDKKSLSLVNELAKIKIQNPEIEIKILKQTRAQDQKQGKRTQETENYLSKVHGIEQKYWKSIVHDKFIVIDDKLIVTTGNFTSTQFAWKEEHRMVYEVLEENRKCTYTVNNTFSEINSYHFIQEDKNIVSSYENHFDNLWNAAEYI